MPAMLATFESRRQRRRAKLASTQLQVRDTIAFVTNEPTSTNRLSLRAPAWWRERLVEALRPHGARRIALAAVRERFGDEIRESDLSKFVNNKGGLGAESAVRLSIVLGIPPPVFIACSEDEADVLFSKQTLLRGHDADKPHRAEGRTDRRTRAQDRNVSSATSPENALTQLERELSAQSPEDQALARERIAREVAPQIALLKAQLRAGATPGHTGTVQGVDGGNVKRKRERGRGGGLARTKNE
jgi:hypothetical protein